MAKFGTTTFSGVIEEFIEVLRIDRGCSEKTIEAYRLDLSQFDQWLSQIKPTQTWDQVTSHQLHQFLGSLTKKGQKATSISRKTSSLRQFYKFCCLEKGCQENPAENLETPSLSKRLPKYLTAEQVTALLSSTQIGIPYAGHSEIKDSPLQNALRARDAAMVYLIYATGVRVSELVGLTLHQIEISQGYIRVRGKGDKERIAPFAPIAGEKLFEYLEKHRAVLAGYPKGEGNPIAFLNHRGQPISRQSFWKTLKTLALQAGVTSKLSPHMMRHSFATHLLQAGMNLRSLQMLLGHSDLSTTQIYAHVAPEHLKESHKKFHPRGGG